MEVSQEISSPLFDFSSFCQNDFLTDCNLVLKDPDGNTISTIRAHLIVLCNSSDYFLDIFDNGLSESVTKIADIRCTNEIESILFPQIIGWMYKGQIDISPDICIPILHMARYLKIKKLEEELEKYMDQEITANDIIPLISQCYDLQYPSELEFLDKYIINCFDKIPISNLSDSLDVRTFCRIIGKMQFDIEKRIDIINQFISSYEPNEEERDCLLETLGSINQKLKSLVKNKNITWLPVKFLKTC